jgi:hypothetical protein
LNTAYPASGKTTSLGIGGKTVNNVMASINKVKESPGKLVLLLKKLIA